MFEKCGPVKEGIMYRARRNHLRWESLTHSILQLP